MEHLTDEALVDRVRQGCLDACRVLVDRHKGHVFTLIRCRVENRETAEDIAQEVFIKLFRSLSQFKGDSKFSTWLYRLTLNAVTDHLRANRRKPVAAVLESIRDWFADLRAQPEEQAIRREERETVVKLLLQLPAKYRDILYLYHYRQMTYAEIAELLGIPVKTVETRLYRGKSMLKQHLEVYGYGKHSSGGPNAGAVSKS